MEEIGACLGENLNLRSILANFTGRMAGYNLLYTPVNIDIFHSLSFCLALYVCCYGLAIGRIRLHSKFLGRLSIELKKRGSNN